MASSPADEVVLRLPDDERHAFKEPLGALYRDADALLAAVDPPIIAVGDVVTASLVGADHIPAVSVLDGRTERGPVSDAVGERTSALERALTVDNPPATITRAAAAAVTAAIAAHDPVCIGIDGEEDLLVVPAILVAPTGATVVYGQPGEGMVAVPVTESAVETVIGLLDRLEGDQAVLRAIVGR